jgi:c-di-GMP-binding flagellar brake protein YcgR
METETGTVRGVLSDVSLGGAGVDFPAYLAPMLKVNSAKMLLFDENTMGAPLAMKADVCNVRVALGGRLRVGFRFLDLDALRRVLNPEMWVLFNRRASFRAVFDAPLVAEVKFDSVENMTSCRILDLSATGASLAVDEVVAEEISVLDGLALTFELPDERDLQLRGDVRRLQAERGWVRMAAAFDVMAAPFDDVHNLLTRWVLHWHRHHMTGLDERLHGPQFWRGPRAGRREWIRLDSGLPGGPRGQLSESGHST